MRNAFAKQITELAQRDDRVVLLSGDIGNRLFDDLKANATLAAMMAYLASEDPEKITRERIDLAVVADSINAANALLPPPAPGAAQRIPPLTTWPSCGAAARKTNPRLR